MILIDRVCEEFKSQGNEMELNPKIIIIGPSSEIESIDLVSIFGIMEEMAGDKGVELNLFELLLTDQNDNTTLQEIIEKANSYFK